MIDAVFHGIGAYIGQQNPIAMGRLLNKCLSGVEVCGADRPIRAFGAILGGDCRQVFSEDCWSVVNSHGKRELSGGFWGETLNRPNTQQEFEAFCRIQHPKNHQYSEAWVTPWFLRALWVKDWADKKTKKAAKILAKHRSVPLLVVTGSTRIWDVADSNQLPFTVRIGGKTCKY